MDRSFKNPLLNYVKTQATGKAQNKISDLCWDSRFISSGFIYKGVKFQSKLQYGWPKPISDEEASELEVDLIYEHLNQWQSIEHTLITWFNMCPTQQHVAVWFPDELVQDLAMEKATEPVELVKKLEALKETDEYLVLESLISYNNLLET